MIEWLNENGSWLAPLGAIASVIALFTPMFKKNRSKGNEVTAENGSVASGGDMNGSTITTNNTVPKKQSNDSEG